MTRTTKLFRLFLFSFVLLVVNQASSKQLNDSVYIKVGKAQVKGKVTSVNHTNFKDQYLSFIVVHPVTNEVSTHNIPISSEGHFSGDVQLQTNQAIVIVKSSLNEDASPIFTKLQNGIEHMLNLHYDAQVNLEQIITKPEVPKYDILETFNVLMDMISYDLIREKEPIYTKNHDAYFDYVSVRVEDRLEPAKTNTLLSPEMKDFISKELILSIYINNVFDYETEMEKLYAFLNQEGKDTLVINKVDRAYYHFLKQLELNDNRYFRNTFFPELQNQILLNKHINLPKLGDGDIAEWIKEAKSILAELVGFKDGLYYEVLAANNYGIQLSEQLTPLNEQQKVQIAKYWKDSEIAKALLLKNEQVVSN